MLPKVKVPRIRKPTRTPVRGIPRPRLDNGDEAEVLSGSVRDMKASAIEERFAKALDKERIPFEFRYTIGAPRGVPGWFEVDFIIEKNGIIYPIEIDTAFTHRMKGRADVLHDAKVLSELNQTGMNVFPKVLHIKGEEELMNQSDANKAVSKIFG